jgi:hypothetical protein
MNRETGKRAAYCAGGLVIVGGIAGAANFASDEYAEYAHTEEITRTVSTETIRSIDVVLESGAPSKSDITSITSSVQELHAINPPRAPTPGIYEESVIRLEALNRLYDPSNKPEQEYAAMTLSKVRDNLTALEEGRDSPLVTVFYGTMLASTLVILSTFVFGAVQLLYRGIVGSRREKKKPPPALKLVEKSV